MRAGKPHSRTRGNKTSRPLFAIVTRIQPIVWKMNFINRAISMNLSMNLRIKKILAPLIRIVANRQANKIISFLEKHECKTARSLGIVLKETISMDLEPNGKQWSDKIESLRKNLLSSTQEIDIIDYGAGSSEFNRSEDEMLKSFISKNTVGQVCKASKPRFWALLFHKLIRKIKPTHCLEMGTCMGISASYQASALALNKQGFLHTLEGSPVLAELSRKHIESLGLETNVRVYPGRFADTLEAVLMEIGTVDYAFIDGHHDEKPPWNIFKRFSP